MSIDSPNPGDPSRPGDEQTGENACPDCGGTGRLAQGPCPTCGGSGKVTETVGDA
jgi:DnaJ-class molecular chaperone